MSNAGIVLKKWHNHTKNNIGAKQGTTNAGMKFDKKGTPVKKLSSFHLVGDTAGATECYLTGHGGSFDSDYFLDNKTFTVPQGVTIQFYQPDGYILGYDTTFLRNGAPVKHGGTSDQVYTGGMECPNYILSKDQGSRLNGDAVDAATMEMDYAGAQSVAGDMGVVLVTVRNRWFHAGVTLKKAVNDVRDAAKSITTFNCLFCRVREGHTSDRWCAASGQWFDV